MNLVPVLVMLAGLNTSSQQLSLHDLAIEDQKSDSRKEMLIGLANPMAALVENDTDQMIIT